MAIIIKRQSVEDFGEDRREVLTEVQQLITGGNMQMVILFALKLIKGRLYLSHFPINVSFQTR